jgi:diguanylate cyclase (GGDEF)-like protein/PAS domain S-box-containing protein
MSSASTQSIHSWQVRAEQVKLLYQNAPLAYALTLINGAILIYVQSEYIAPTTLFAWYGGLLLVTVIRAMTARQYARLRPGPAETEFWRLAYVAGAGAAGCIWGSAALLLFPAESMAHQVFVAFVLAGMAAGGVGVLASRMEACMAFLVPLLVPLAIRYLALPTALQMAMGVMTLFFLAGLTVSAGNFHRSIRRSLYLRFDKQDLEHEIARRHQVEEQLFQEKDRLQTILSSIGEGVALIDAEDRIEYLNPAAEQLCGWSIQQAMHRPAGEVFECFDGEEQRIPTAMQNCLQAAEQIRKQSVLLCKRGSRHIVEEVATPLYDRHSKTIGAVSVFRDVTEAALKSEQLAYAADHDPLTGLPNRNLLKDRTRQAIARAQRKHEGFALLFLDLDRFKAINDSMGHASGDALLVDVARRLTDCVREEDTIARLGGDEFVVLLDGPMQKKQVEVIAGKILQTLNQPFRLGEHWATVSASIGASLYPGNGHDTESLLGHADAAMYRAKQLGRNQACCP